MPETLSRWPGIKAKRWPSTPYSPSTPASRSTFGDPKSPWQRGSKENTNGLLLYFPKTTDMAAQTPDQVNEAAYSLNSGLDRPGPGGPQSVDVR